MCWLTDTHTHTHSFGHTHTGFVTGTTVFAFKVFREEENPLKPSSQTQQPTRAPFPFPLRLLLLGWQHPEEL